MSEQKTESMAAGADISPCGQYRYALWRDWDWQGYGNRVAFVGLNPSTADATQDDPTIRKCIGFAKRWGFGGLLMLNAYAYRATQPKDMIAAVDPIGPRNDEALSYRVMQVGAVVVAWGNDCDAERERRVCQMLRGAARRFNAWARTSRERQNTRCICPTKPPAKTSGAEPHD